MEQYTYFVSALFALCPFVTSLITEKSINPKRLLEGYRERRFKHHCMIYGISQEEIDDLKLSLESTLKERKEPNPIE